MRRTALLSALLALCWSVSASAAERLAFIVGVDSYPKLDASAQLQRPSADAQAVAAAAQSLGYRTTLIAPSVTREMFVRRFSSFKQQVQPGDTVMVYFAGHGLAIQGTNYLLPSDMPPIEADQEFLARTSAMAEADLSAELRARGARVVVMVIDACRNNPFARTGTRAVGEARGLSPSEPAEGVFSLYSAGAGQQALDRLPGEDSDPNSVFTRIFVRQMKKPGMNLIDLGESVRDEVAHLAESVPHKQVPAYYNEVRGARFLSLASTDPLPKPDGAPPSPAVATRPDPAPLPAVLPRPAQPSAQPALQPSVQPKPNALLQHPPSSVQIPPPASTLARPPTERPAPLLGQYSHPIRLDPAGDNWLALRSQPSGRDGFRIAKLGPGELFSVIGRQGAWVNVRLRNGLRGWVHGDYVGCCRQAPITP